jgi:hypothetical protein
MLSVAAAAGCSSSSAPDTSNNNGPNGSPDGGTGGVVDIGGGVPDSVDEENLSDEELGALLMHEDERDLDSDGNVDTGTEPADEPEGEVTADEEAYVDDSDPANPPWTDDISGSANDGEPIIGSISQAATPAPGKMFGLGVDVPRATSSPLYAQLKDKWKMGSYSLGAVRRVYYVQGDQTAEGKNTDAWLAGAGGLQPTMGLSIKTNRILTSHPLFRARFWRLLQKYKQVPQWGVTNEPDLEIPRDEQWAKEAVEYFIDGAQTLRRCLRKAKCSRTVRVIAGEFSYQGDVKSKPYWEKYGAMMLRNVKTATNPKGRLKALPKTWGFHPYYDTTQGVTTGTRSLSSFLGKLEKDPDSHVKKGALRLWLTETGTLLEHGGATRLTCTTAILGKPDLQRKGGSAVYALAKLGRVDRVYWWQFQQADPGWPGRWDSAMIDNTGKPRASFCALAGDAAGCDGYAYSKNCPP